jgi:hypothetical protein
MTKPDPRDAALLELAHAIVAGDNPAVTKLLAASPALATARIATGANRRGAPAYFLDAIGLYLYAGSTALHVAAAAYRAAIAQRLIAAGADVRTNNRRGAGPLHAAADGAPDSARWDPDAQAATIRCLIEAGADPNAVASGGVTPLHRAVRARCAAAVKTLLDHGADALLPNDKGSTPMLLATQNTGRGGSGSGAAKAQQQEIVGLLAAHGAPRR